MKKFLPVIFALTFQTFAFHNMAFTPDTAKFGIDSVKISGDFEHLGDTAKVKMFFKDINKNGTFDQGDIDIIGGQVLQFIDGGTSDGNGPVDTVKNGKFEEVFTTGSGGPFESEGQYVMVVESGNIADTASIVIIQPQTNTYVKGTIADPSGNLLKGIAVRAVVFNSSDNQISRVSSLTDAQGKFIIYLSDTYRNHKINLAIDPNNSVPGKIDPSWIIPGGLDTTIIDSLVGLNGKFKVASNFVRGRITDETGASVKSGYFFFSNVNNNIQNINFTTDNNGKFLLPIAPGSYTFYMDAERNNWKYLSQVLNFAVKDSADTTNVEPHVYNADTVISGKIFDPDGILSDTNKIEVDAYGTNDNVVTYQGYIYTSKSGQYSVKTSSKLASYGINFRVNKLPQSYHVYSIDYQKIKLGTDTCDVYLRKASATISGKVTDSTGGKIYSNIVFVDSAQQFKFSINSDGNGNFSEPVPAGKYMIYFFGFSQVLNKNVMGISGPLTVSNKDSILSLIANTSEPALPVIRTKLKNDSFSFSVVNKSGLIDFCYGVPVDGTVKIQIFNLSGQLLNTAFNKYISAGEYHLKLNVSNTLLSNNLLVVKMNFKGKKIFSSSALIRMH